MPLIDPTPEEFRKHINSIVTTLVALERIVLALIPPTARESLITQLRDERQRIIDSTTMTEEERESQQAIVDTFQGMLDRSLPSVQKSPILNQLWPHLEQFDKD